MTQNLDKIDTKKHIIIKGAKLHNLKNIDVVIPRNKFIVITGLSGSGKSTLAFDTLYAEGQRRYVESLSAYARQFLGRLEKPQVDYIKGISPAIAIEQKVISRNPRSTVGTVTEIYDYLKLLFARIGKTISPISGEEVKRHSVSDVVDFILSKEDETLVYVCVLISESNIAKAVEKYSQQGFTRLLINEEVKRIDEVDAKRISKKDTVRLLIDRLKLNKSDDDLISRVSDSVQTAFYEGNGSCEILIPSDKKNQSHTFSNLFEADGIKFEVPSVNFFSFNNPVGACKTCEGFGSIIGIDPDLVIPNKSLSVFDGAVVCWNGETMSKFKNKLIKNAHQFDFPVHKPISKLTKEQYDLLWEGNKHFEGINKFFKMLEKESYKIQYRVILARYRGKTQCPDCLGTRLRKDANYVKVNHKNLQELVLMPIKDSYVFFNSLKLNKHDEQISKRLLIEINNRLKYLLDVGLGYLTLNRLANSLSGGESQRINLATQLGSSLVGSLYILDEPSIGLHSRDTERLISVLNDLKQQGNTIIVVEHDEDIMRAADIIIDIGPEAGQNGGEVVFSGTLSELARSKESLTAKYLTNKLSIPVPKRRRTSKDWIKIVSISDNNLKSVTTKFPLNVLCVVTGVSGSGKSTLVKNGLHQRMQRYLDGYYNATSHKEIIDGSLSRIKQLEYIDQNPIGKSSRSNPVTYIKAYDEIRNLYAEQGVAKMRGYKAGHFSFNVEGGRCEVCQGEGVVTVEMQFMADIQLTCESCHGKRFKSDTLEVLYRGKTISDILDLTVDEAVAFFEVDDKNKTVKKVLDKIKTLQEVGLGYVHLGQSSSTLSGGEAQRVKLANFLVFGKSDTPILFIFDEPTTGLHFHDVNKLLKSFEALIERGHSIVVIEHNMEVIKSADWVIDMGPDSGEEGGEVVFEGTPEELVKEKKSITGQFLKEKL
ncbi:MAG: excinuclease ABC subunit UvrA [Bacteroidia bacterium]